MQQCAHQAMRAQVQRAPVHARLHRLAQLLLQFMHAIDQGCEQSRAAGPGARDVAAITAADRPGIDQQ